MLVDAPRRALPHKHRVLHAHGLAHVSRADQEAGLGLMIHAAIAESASLAFNAQRDVVDAASAAAFAAAAAAPAAARSSRAESSAKSALAQDRAARRCAARRHQFDLATSRAANRLRVTTRAA